MAEHGILLRLNDWDVRNVPLETFLELAEDRDLSLVVVNRNSPAPIQSLLESLFETLSVGRGGIPPRGGPRMVYLLEDRRVVASSPLSALRDAILMVNSDLYISGACSPEAVDPPDVIADMDGVNFRLRGYPESNKEKLLLIPISRFIERLALESEGGQASRLVPAPVTDSGRARDPVCIRKPGGFTGRDARLRDTGLESAGETRRYDARRVVEGFPRRVVRAFQA